MTLRKKLKATPISIACSKNNIIFFFKMKTKFLLPNLVILLSLPFVSSHYSHSKYEQKYVDVNSWSFSDTEKGKRYLIQILLR